MASKKNLFWGKGSVITAEQYLNERKPVIEKCIGCKRIVDEDYCKVYLYPTLKWRLGKCNFNTHCREVPVSGKKKMNALKASRRQARGRL
ncbi:unnamed protein product [marine sediment metagenome]|uniref:Uncharacterized protein n=1 Tax=marine sediment metagenome TaxID=412755 RepID=X0SEB9_9ZZZZ